MPAAGPDGSQPSQGATGSPVTSSLDDSQPNDSDKFIAVMGVTGVGKSTFISHITKCHVEIGSTMRSCTQHVGAYPVQWMDGTRIFLVDTPGFDDTDLSDSEVLKEVAAWLTRSYEDKVRLSGIIYFHRITDPKMQGSAKRNLLMFKKLCGPDALKMVILATTMWEQVNQEVGEAREEELRTTEEYWGCMVQRGSRIFRHTNNPDSALRLVRLFLREHRLETLAIQSEMVDNGWSLDQTAAGQELDSVLAKEREKFRRDLDYAQQQMKEAIEARDKESEEMLRQHQEETNKKIKALEEERQNIRITMEKLHEENAAKPQKRLDEEKEQASKMKEAVEMLTKKMKALPTKVVRTRSAPGKNRISEYASLALQGSSYAFIGPAQDFTCFAFIVPGQDFPMAASGYDKWPRYMALGQNGSFYLHYHTPVDDKCQTQRAGLKKEYPDLDKWITNSKSYGCPVAVSLGPDGDFWCRMGKSWDYCLPESFPDEDFARVNRIWFGYGGAYVVERKNGSKTWNLRQHYSGLGRFFKEYSFKIKDLAMNVGSPTEYVLLTTDGSCSYNLREEGETGNVKFAFEEYMTTNFGTKF
ncbi:hypothetical protein RB596_004311 [Gaeumannomyces avenae]